MQGQHGLTLLQGQIASVWVQQQVLPVLLVLSSYKTRARSFPGETGRGYSGSTLLSAGHELISPTVLPEGMAVNYAGRKMLPPEKSARLGARVAA